jgi:hypothetical protein
MTVTAANRAAVISYVREQKIDKPDAGDIAKKLGLSKAAVAEALTGFDPKAATGPDPALTGGSPAGVAPNPSQAFEALVPQDGGVHVDKYADIADAFKDLGKDTQKNELKFVESKGQFGLAKYLKDTTHSGSFWDSLGSAIGESLFGGNR